MKRPLTAIVSCYVIGLLLAQFFQPSLIALFGITFVVLFLVLVLEKLRSFLIWPLLVLVGWTNYVSRTATLSPNDLRTLLGNDTALATVRGTLIETPHLKITEHNGGQTEHVLALVQVTELRRGENSRLASGKIIITTPGILAGNFFAGQAVEISGVIAPPPAPLAGGLFDYRDYLQTRGIYYGLKTSSTNDWQLRAPILLKPPLTDRFLNWSQKTLAFGLPVEDEPLRLIWVT